MKPVPVLTIVDKATGKPATEVYMLNPGESFERFGGSRHALTVRKTASLITRSYAGGGISDTEYDITNPGCWAWIARLINDPTLGIEAKAVDGAVES